MEKTDLVGHSVDAINAYFEPTTCNLGGCRALWLCAQKCEHFWHPKIRFSTDFMISKLRYRSVGRKRATGFKNLLLNSFKRFIYMPSIFLPNMKCNQCLKEMNYVKNLKFNEYALDGWKCACGEIYFNPEQVHKILLLNKVY